MEVTIRIEGLDDNEKDVDLFVHDSEGDNCVLVRLGSEHIHIDSTELIEAAARASSGTFRADK